MPNIATLWILFGGAFIIATAGKSKELEINGQIRDREVRLIGADGEQKGVVSIQVAMRAAEDAGLDLVKIAPQAVPPVCKVLDYGKYRFEQQKKEKDGTCLPVLPVVVELPDSEPSGRLALSMRQLKLDIGLYIGKNIRLYYQTPGCKDEPVCAFVADFQKDDMNGSAICDLLLYENFSPEKMNGFVMDAIHG